MHRTCNAGCELGNLFPDLRLWTPSLYDHPDTDYGFSAITNDYVKLLTHANWSQIKSGACA